MLNPTPPPTAFSMDTPREFRRIISECKHIFSEKMKVYGDAWRAMRAPALTDILLIKAERVRSIEEKRTQKIADTIENEYKGIINYCIIALIFAHRQDVDTHHLPSLALPQAQTLYDREVEQIAKLLDNKNHDYAEAWRKMRTASIHDVILMKIFRIQQMENNHIAKHMKNVASTYQDIVNYAVFALIKQHRGPPNMSLFAYILRSLIGLVFLFSGLVKINDPVGTAIKLEEYFGVFSADIAHVFSALVPMALSLSIALIVLEIILGVALLIGYPLRGSLWMTLGLLIFFSFLTFYSAYFDKVTDCGCFGDAIKLSPWQSFGKDIILLVLSLGLFAVLPYTVQKRRRRHILASIGVLGLVLLSSIGAAMYAVGNLPYIDLRAYQVGAHLPTLMQPSGTPLYRYVFEKDRKTHYFEEFPSDTSFVFQEAQLTNPEILPKISDYAIWNEDEDATQASFQGKKLFLVVQDVPKIHTHLEAIKAWAQNLPQDIDTWTLSSSSSEAYIAFAATIGFPRYYADATVLKTMMRAKIGLVLMQEGTIRAKWHYRNLPSVQEIEAQLR